MSASNPSASVLDYDAGGLQHCVYLIRVES